MRIWAGRPKLLSRPESVGGMAERNTVQDHSGVVQVRGCVRLCLLLHDVQLRNWS